MVPEDPFLITFLAVFAFILTLFTTDRDITLSLGPSSRVLISTCVLIHRDEKSNASVRAVLSILESLYSK